MSLLQARVKAALGNGLVADGLSMPVHWFYNPRDIYRMFGAAGITRFEDAPATHPSSIMSLHSTDRGGRWSASSASSSSSAPPLSVVGDVILKGRKKYWGIPNTHYHHGLKAGQNTLNADCARLVTRIMIQNRDKQAMSTSPPSSPPPPSADTFTPPPLEELDQPAEKPFYTVESFLEGYISFMQDPLAYPDVYAESYHRGFFANYAVHRLPPRSCGAHTHDTPSIGGFVTLVPVILGELLRDRNVDRVKDLTREHLFLTHPDAKLGKKCDIFVELLDQLLFREAEDDGRSSLATAYGKTVGGTAADLPALVARHSREQDDEKVVGGIYSTACYIDGSFPSVLFLAYKYAHQPVTETMLRNTNLGGENCHRGYVLGAILGLLSAQLSPLYRQLAELPRIDMEINQFLS